ncbi:MAG: DUF4198 domain-containing protein [Gemmatales bacterium]|nr:DUF4198 domain-containing protein [Gemmatales bacterium]MDW8387120.1 hypothetical protein [Gemmatales bacterium]
MRRSSSIVVATALAVVVILSVGCGRTPPQIVEVEGVLYLDDQPLPFAQIEFMPELKHFGAEYNSMAVTDAQGRFKLECANGQPGAAVATHRVVVLEGPPPEGARGMDERSQNRLAEYMANLPNRPIPEVFGNYSRTPARVEVKPEQKTYEIRLRRETTQKEPE